MVLSINNILFSKKLQEKLNENKELKEFAEEFKEKVSYEDLKAMVWKDGQIEWNMRTDTRTGEEYKNGLKFLNISVKINGKTLLIKANFGFHYQNRGELYVMGIVILNRSKLNGVPLTLTGEMSDRSTFENQMNELAENNNFLQVYNDTADIVAAIKLYEVLTNEKTKEGSESFPINSFNKTFVRGVDASFAKDNPTEFIKASTEYFVNADNVNLVPKDNLGKKDVMMLTLSKPEKLPRDLKKTLRLIIKDRGQLSLSQEEKFAVSNSYAHLIDFKIERIGRKDSKLTLFIDEVDFEDNNFIQVFDKLNWIKNRTMLSVVQDIEMNRINNNNVFQFLFNKGSYANLAVIEDWIVNDAIAKERSEGLYEEQKKAFAMSIDNQPLTFIQGPPGTGKTHTITEICKYYRALGKKVLLSSQTNVAVENILENLWEDKTFAGMAIKADFGKKKYSIESVKERLEEKFDLMFGFENTDLSDFEFADIAYESIIVGSTTTSSALSKRSWNNYDKDIDVLIVDEISKSSVPELIRYVANSKKIIFVGDQKQLAPMNEFDEYDDIWDNYTQNDKKIIAEYINASIFDSLFETMKKHGRTVMLQENGRSVKSLLDIYSTFYDNKLIARREDEDSRLQWNTKPWSPFTFVAVNGSKEIKTKTFSRKNVLEAGEVKTILEELAESLDNSKGLTVAVIALYGAQVQEIALQVPINEMTGKLFKSIRINTVDAFQGDQADIVILSTIRADASMSAGFVKDYRRVNVALSRAKDLVVVLGNDRILKSIDMPYDGTNRLFFDEIFRKAKLNQKEDNKRWIDIRKVDNV